MAGSKVPVLPRGIKAEGLLFSAIIDGGSYTVPDLTDPEKADKLKAEVDEKTKTVKWKCGKIYFYQWSYDGKGQVYRKDVLSDDGKVKPVEQLEFEEIVNGQTYQIDGENCTAVVDAQRRSVNWKKADGQWFQKWTYVGEYPDPSRTREVYSKLQKGAFKEHVRYMVEDGDIRMQGKSVDGTYQDKTLEELSLEDIKDGKVYLVGSDVLRAVVDKDHKKVYWVPRDVDINSVNNNPDEKWVVWEYNDDGTVTKRNYNHNQDEFYVSLEKKETGERLNDSLTQFGGKKGDKITHQTKRDFQANGGFRQVKGKDGQMHLEGGLRTEIDFDTNENPTRAIVMQLEKKKDEGITQQLNLDGGYQEDVVHPDVVAIFSDWDAQTGTWTKLPIPGKEDGEKDQIYDRDVENNENLTKPVSRDPGTKKIQPVQSVKREVQKPPVGVEEKTQPKENQTKPAASSPTVLTTLQRHQMLKEICERTKKRRDRNLNLRVPRKQR